MSFSSSQWPPPPNPDLLGPVDSRWPDGFRPNVDRSILGIPPAQDEYTRGGMTFFPFDPSSPRLPSVFSTSQESGEMGDDSPPYEPSRSSQNPSSCQVLTPQSVSDASGGPHHRSLSFRSVGSSDGGISDFGVERQYSPSVSVRASAGSTSRAASSHEMIQTSSLLPTTAMMSPGIDPSILGSRGDPSDDPQKIIWLDPTDVRCLEELLSQENSRQREPPAQKFDPADLVVDPMDLEDDPRDLIDYRMKGVDDEIPQPVSPSHSGFTHGSSIECEGVAPMKTMHTRAGKRRAQKISRSRPRLTGQQASAEDAIETREMQKLMRRIGSCLTCLVNHEKCGPGDICPRCMKSARIPKALCIRTRLRDAQLFRTEALSFPGGPPIITQWVSKRNVTLHLFNLGPANVFVPPKSRPHLTVKCRQFPSTPEICSVKIWTKGADKIIVDLPNFAMTKTQLSTAAKTLEAVIEAQYDDLVAEFVTVPDDIVSLTLAEARRKAEKCDAIRDALRLSIISRLVSKSFNIFGDETLGIQQDQDPDSPYYNRIPIPPLLDAQIDFVLMDKMKVLGRRVLSKLRHMVAGEGHKDWYKIFLTMSVLLINLESVDQNKRQQIKRYQATPQQQRILESWEHSARNLIAHFRAVCRGFIPLNMEWSKAEQDAAEMDDHSLEFIARLKTLRESRAEELCQMSTASPDTPLKWFSALFAPSEDGYAV